LPKHNDTLPLVANELRRLASFPVQTMNSSSVGSAKGPAVENTDAMAGWPIGAVGEWSPTAPVVPIKVSPEIQKDISRTSMRNEKLNRLPRGFQVNSPIPL
jgi:hypothetical protein